MSTLEVKDIRVQLESAFLEALNHLGENRIAEGRSLLESIIEKEPRFPEPHLEMALIHHVQGNLERAVEEARLSLELLEDYGQWVDELKPEEMTAHAMMVLGYLLVEQAEALELVSGQDSQTRLWNEAVGLFKLACENDPENEEARAAVVLYKPV